MFYEINIDQFPIVNIHLRGNIENKDSFQAFTQEWEHLYDYNQPFYIIIHTESFVSNGVSPDYIQYVFMIASFLKRMRKEKPPLLHRTIICVYNHWVVKLMHLLFVTHSPLAPVYIIQGSNLSPITVSLWCQFIMNQGYMTREMKSHVTFVPSKYRKETHNPQAMNRSPSMGQLYSDYRINTDAQREISTSDEENGERNEEEEEETDKGKSIQQTIQKELSKKYIKEFQFSPSPDEETLLSRLSFKKA